MSSTQNPLEVSPSLVKCIMTGPRCTGFFLYLLLWSRLLQWEVSVIQMLHSLKMVSIPKTNELLPLASQQNKSILRLFFCIEKSNIWIARNYHSASRTGRIFLWTNQSFEFPFRGSKWCSCEFSLFDSPAISDLGLTSGLGG